MKKTILLTIALTAILALVLSIGVFATEEATTAPADDTTVGAIETDDNQPGLLSMIFNGGSLAILGAAVAVGLAGIGSAKGVGMVGEATSGLLTENPNAFGKAFVLMALPMTQGIYGLVIAFLIVLRVGLFAEGIDAFVNLPIEKGAYYLMSALPIGCVGLVSALKQARVSASGINLLAKRPDQVMKAVTSAALVETYAIFALLISVLLVLMG